MAATRTTAKVMKPSQVTYEYKVETLPDWVTSLMEQKRLREQKFKAESKQIRKKFFTK